MIPGYAVLLGYGAMISGFGAIFPGYGAINQGSAVYLGYVLSRVLELCF